MGLPECDECRAILADFLAANRELAREMLESRLGSVPEFAQRWHQARELKTAEDVVLAEQLFPEIQFRSSPGMGLALRRILVHEVRTGHQLRRLLHQG